MKDVNLYLEIAGLAIDEDDSACPAGIKVKLGSLPDDKYEEAVEKMRREAKFDVEKILGMIGLEDYADACRIITEEEYNEKYGDQQCK